LVAIGTLVGVNNGGVNEQVFHAGIATQHVGDSLPNVAVTPKGKVHGCAVPFLELFGQATPCTASAQNSKNCLEE
jgi:hypothetical protein